MSIASKKRVKFYHTEGFKELIGLELAYPFSERLIPFEMFLMESAKDAFNMIKDRIEQEVELDNFWILHLIVTKLFGESATVAEIFVEKLIK